MNAYTENLFVCAECSNVNAKYKDSAVNRPKKLKGNPKQSAAKFDKLSPG